MPNPDELTCDTDAPDLYGIRELLTDEERQIREVVGRFVDERVLPIIGECFEKERFPSELVPEMARLGLFGPTFEDYGCAGLSSVAYGLIMQELERGDSGVRSFASVQSSLCMYPILTYGSAEQKQRWPKLAFTEPPTGSSDTG